MCVSCDWNHVIPTSPRCKVPSELNCNQWLTPLLSLYGSSSSHRSGERCFSRSCAVESQWTWSRAELDWGRTDAADIYLIQEDRVRGVVVVAVALTHHRCGILCKLIWLLHIWGHFVCLVFLITLVHLACCQYLFTVYKLMLVITNACLFFLLNYVFKRFCQYCNEKEYWKSRKHFRRGCYCWRVLRREVSDMHIYTYIYISNVYLYDAVYVPISQCSRHVFNVLFMQCWIVYLNCYYVYLLCIFVLNVILIL